MHSRDPRRLESGVFDITVVGGGIYGLWIAYEAASRGLSVALIERGDFGGGVSFNHQKTAHGGLRSLQTGRIDRARESILERRTLARVAPRFLRPLPFIVGTYRSVSRNRLALQAAFLMDALIGADRNAGVIADLRLPPAKLLSRAETLRMFPGVDPRGLTGGARWYDYQMFEGDRLTVAVAIAADRAGAVLVNHVEAAGVIREQGRIVGIEAIDHLSGGRLAVRSSLTINAAGAHAGTVMGMFGVRRSFPLLRAISIVTSKLVGDHALAAASRAGRMLTLVPWRGCALVGTGHSPRLVSPAEEDAPRTEVEAFVSAANEAFPALELTMDDLALVHRGAIPARPAAGREPSLTSSPEILDHSNDGAAGAMTVVGVKYTTARAVAERVVTRAASVLGRAVPPSTSASAVLPTAGSGNHQNRVAELARRAGIELPAPVVQRLVALQGEAAADVIALMTERPCFQQMLAPDFPVTQAEVVHVIRTEMGVRLRDLLMRRLALSDRHPGAAVVGACSEVAAAELGWNESARAEQIADVDRAYQVP